MRLSCLFLGGGEPIADSPGTIRKYFSEKIKTNYIQENSVK